MPISVKRIQELEVERINALMAGLKPAEDMRPHVQFYLPGVSLPVAMMLEVSGESELRDLLADFLAAMAQKLQVDALVVAMMAWVSGQQGAAPSEASDRRECVWITVETQDANGGAMVFEVKRSDQSAPHLEQPVWMPADARAGIETRGRFAGLLQRPMGDIDPQMLELAESQAQAIRQYVSKLATTRH